MTPITHCLASWVVADEGRVGNRDRALVTWCGLLPDADGLGLLADSMNRLLGRPESWYYALYHHTLLHGIFGALLIPAAMCGFAANRVRTFWLGFVAVHLHLVCDLLGSRGPGLDDIWPIAYLAPFSSRGTVSWSGQWPLDAWPNVVFTAALIGYVLVRAVRAGYSVVGVFSSRADRVFVETVRHRWQIIRRGRAASQGDA